MYLVLLRLSSELRVESCLFLLTATAKAYTELRVIDETFVSCEMVQECAIDRFHRPFSR